MPDSLENLLKQYPITEKYTNLTKAIDAAYSKPQMDAIETSVRYHLANRPSLLDFRRFGRWFIKNYEEIADGKTPSLEQLKQIVNSPERPQVSSVNVPMRFLDLKVGGPISDSPGCVILPPLNTYPGFTLVVLLNCPIVKRETPFATEQHLKQAYDDIKSHLDGLGVEMAQNFGVIEADVMPGSEGLRYEPNTQCKIDATGATTDSVVGFQAVHHAYIPRSSDDPSLPISHNINIRILRVLAKQFPNKFNIYVSGSETYKIIEKTFDEYKTKYGESIEEVATVTKIHHISSPKPRFQLGAGVAGGEVRRCTNELAEVEAKMAELEAEMADSEPAKKKLKL